MSRLAVTLLAGAAALAGCSAFDPFSSPAAPAEHGQPAGQRVGICYNTVTTSLAEVQHEAQRECPPNTMAKPVDTDWYLQYCPLLVPTRASFVCTAK